MPKAAQSCWAQSIDIELKLPSDHRLARLFTNANWANLIDPRGHQPSNFSGTSQVPAIRFQDAAQQFAAVNRIVGILFGALVGFSRSDLRALEWSLNEVTDNVLNHASSPVGGFVQVTNFSGALKRVEFAVADPGVGIPTSLRNGHPELRTDHEALDKAIREGVTRSDAVGQGNGLYGTWRISELSGGRLDIRSGYAALESGPERGLHISQQQVPFAGTLVVANMPYAQPIDLAEAFEFGGRRHEPVDFVDLHFEADADGNPVFSLQRETAGFGSREAGRAVNKKIANLMRVSGGHVTVDCHSVALVSSSFADEVFGMLFKELGPIEFGSRVRLSRVDPLVRSLIDRAILQRARV